MSKPIGMTELVAEVGDDNIEFQNLANCLLEFRARKRDATLRFVTEKDKGQDLALGGGEWVALVVWIPRDKLPKKLRGRRRGA